VQSSLQANGSLSNIRILRVVFSHNEFSRHSGTSAKDCKAINKDIEIMDLY
jgi:hypothetical protein